MSSVCSTYVRDEKIHKIFWFGKPEGKRPIGRARRRWEDNVRMDLREIGYKAVDRIHLVQDRGPMMSCCVQGNEHSGSMKRSEFLN
jgi:hypothetical protein